MTRVKRRTFAGHVCEQEIYFVADSPGGIPAKDRKPRLRFRTEEERAAHRDGIARRAFIRMVNANFSPSSYYSTLTFDREHEVHSFDEAKRIRANYLRRLLRRYPEAVIVAVLGRGKSTRRIHLHMLSEGVPAEAILGLWGMGINNTAEHLRESVRREDGDEVGRDYTALANYLFDHWTPEQGGHRYYKTRNALACEREDARECHTSYTPEKPPLPPKAPEGYAYFLTEVRVTQYGYMNFKYNLIRTVTPTGRARKFEVPRVRVIEHEGAA